MNKQTAIKKTIQACETETDVHNARVAIHNARVDKHDAKQELIKYFNANGVTTGDGKVADGKEFVTAHIADAASAYLATGNITEEQATRRVRDFVVGYCGFRERRVRKSVKRDPNAAVTKRVKFNADKTEVSIGGIKYIKEIK